MKLVTTLKGAIWAAKNLKTQIRDKGVERFKKGEKRDFEGYSRSNKKNGFSKSGHNDKKSWSNNEVKWGEKCRSIHFEKLKEEVTCYKCGSHVIILMNVGTLKRYVLSV